MIDTSSFSLDLALQNLSYAFTSLKALIVALSYVLGVGMVVRGLMMYRQLANVTMSSAQRGELAGPMVWIIVGVILVYFPRTLESSLTTVFATGDTAAASELIGYVTISGVERWREISEIIVNYMKLIGYIAFLRGWIILSKMGHSGSQPGSIGKGIVHIVGGVLLINVIDTVNLLARTFGLTV
ncbi:hypothetical protein CC99x_005280 [Candidatus Berkiella cookevillensis]|uniref:Uncharacterized protein n=1 Tax=Candidatus Berkiella cookevillensis TaxID=437022 RepID=A0A0Q9YHL7_9GAMM|nr:hypothetical protein [Candidatus Berkiella cookevillensis]MCS5708313.1 hypothetical protein [Candidatus Berkiella cookevillensis]